MNIYTHTQTYNKTNWKLEEEEEVGESAQLATHVG